MTSVNLRLVLFVYSIIITGLLVSCNLNREKNPLFTLKTQLLEDSIKKMIYFKEIKLSGSEQLFNENSSTLKIEIINPPNRIASELSFSEDFAFRQIARMASVIVKRALKNSNEYKNFQVAFIRKKNNWLNTTISKYYFFESNNL